MLQFAHPQGFDPFTTKAFGSGDEQQFSGRYYSAFPVNWQAQSSAHALLLNATGLLVYGGATIEYVLNAFAKTYGGAAIEYILGFIVEADFVSSGAGTAPFVPNVEYVTNTVASSGAGTTLVAVERLIDSIVASTATGIGTTLTNLTSDVFVASTANTAVVFAFEGEEYDVWVFNADTFAASRYVNFNFNSFAAYRGRYYGANAAGLYELSGDTDAGAVIAASLTLGRMNFGTSQLKHVFRAYLSGTSEGKLVLRVVGDDGAVRTYKTNVPLGDIINYKRVDPAKGLSAHYWQFSIENELGQDFALDSMDIYPVVLQRRVK